MKAEFYDNNMQKYEKVLIMRDEDISVYNEDFLSHIPNSMKIGGVITVVNNHNNESRHKEWKWFACDDGTVFNDKEHVIDMLSGFVRRL